MRLRPRQRRPFLLTAAAAVVVLAAVLFMARRGGDPSAAPTTLTALRGTCAVLTHARQGDAPLAKRTFVDQAHEPLHELATQTSKAGRRDQVARLLEAKNRVEASSAGPTVADAEQLVAATRNAIRALGEPAGACPN